MTLNEARMCVSKDQIEWIDGANGCAGAIGTVGFDHKTCSHYVDWPDGQRTWLNDGPALACMRVIKQAEASALAARPGVELDPDQWRPIVSDPDSEE